MVEWMNGWMDGCMDEWLDGWMDEWLDGWMSECNILQMDIKSKNENF